MQTIPQQQGNLFGRANSEIIKQHRKIVKLRRKNTKYEQRLTAQSLEIMELLESKLRAQQVVDFWLNYMHFLVTERGFRELPLHLNASVIARFVCDPVQREKEFVHILLVNTRRPDLFPMTDEEMFDGLVIPAHLRTNYFPANPWRSTPMWHPPPSPIRPLPEDSTISDTEATDSDQEQVDDSDDERQGVDSDSDVSMIKGIQ